MFIDADGMTLLEKTDSAMYQAKIGCRTNFQVFSSQQIDVKSET
jgi:hypothetical protein